MSSQLPPIPPSSRDRRARANRGRSRRSVLAASDIAGIVVLGVIGLAVAIVLALVIVRGFSLRDPAGSHARATASASGATRPAVVTAPAGNATGSLAGAPWAGAVRPAKIRSASATCGQHDLRTPTGGIVQFKAAQAIDGQPATAWRCAGSGVGRTLTISLRGATRVAAVGLIPGFAGVDPLVGSDAFLRDRRIETVRWALGSATIVQTLDPNDPHLQLLHIPATLAGKLSMTILRTTTAGEDDFAVSDIAVYAVR